MRSRAVTGPSLDEDGVAHLRSEPLRSSVLKGADGHHVRAQLAKDRGDAETLRHHATEALRLATCDGLPDYTYKAAYDEATALLR